MHLIHRGIIKKKCKENLLKSFKQSFNKGYGIETDIHATKDHKFICFHDFTLKRIFKKNLSVKNLNYSKIKEISTTLKKPIPLLNDLLLQSNNKYPLFIEIKPFLTKTLLKKLLKETAKFKKCVFISFKHMNIYNLLRIKKKNTEEKKPTKKAEAKKSPTKKIKVKTPLKKAKKVSKK